MSIVDVVNVNKAFRGASVVADLSFSIESGEILGLVGPNGAGKTTTIRMLMDIIKPDSGEIKILGKPINEDTKNRVGYLPEERGLYKKLSMIDSLVYLAALKGVDRRTAEARSEKLLKMVNMYVHRHKKTDELSHGMGQLVQFVTTIIHDPELVIFDEPFMALDPVNTQLLKDLIIEQKKSKKTVILSTHMMNQVEELCDRVLMINRGKAVLYGNLAEIKAKYRYNSVIIAADKIPDQLKGVREKKERNGYTELFLDGSVAPQDLLKSIIQTGAAVSKFEISTPSLNEIFIQVAREG